MFAFTWLRRKTSCLALLPALLLAVVLLAPSAVRAQSVNATIDLSDTNPPATGTGWSYSGNTYTINSGATVTVTGASAAPGPCIDVAAAATSVTITLQDANIPAGCANGASPIKLESGASVTLQLVGTSTLVATATTAAGINAPAGTNVVINDAGNGILNVTGALYGAGIGGNGGQAGGHIEIDSGIVNATSGDYGAGLGGGSDSAGGTTIIDGSAEVTAIGGGYSGTGIGGGSSDSGGNNGGDGGTITIGGDAKVTALGGISGTGIGGGNGNADNGGAGGTITINGNAQVTATGNINGPGIGGGNGKTGGAGGTITINGNAQVTATGSGGSAGIGGGMGEQVAGGAGGIINIGGSAKVTATSGGTDAGGGAGIGGGGASSYSGSVGGASGTITIGDSAQVMAIGNGGTGSYGGGAGIGSGGAGLDGAAGSVGTITVASLGAVAAAGGVGGNGGVGGDGGKGAGVGAGGGNSAGDDGLDNSTDPASGLYAVVASAGTGGSIALEGAWTVNRYQTFIITPDTNYTIDKVLVNGTNDEPAVLSGAYNFVGTPGAYTLAASFAQPIDSVALTGVTAPVRDQTPSLTNTVTTANVAEQVGSAAWSPAIPSGGTFAGGTAYTFSVTLEPDDGYAFTGDLTATVNGLTTTDITYNDDGSVTLSYTFPATTPAPTQPIDSVALTGVTAPATGATASVANTVATLNVTEVTDSAAWSPTLPASGAFAQGTAYTFTATVKANTGYAFVASGLTATVNGQTAQVTPNADGTVTLAYTFPPTLITSVALPGAAPATGATAATAPYATPAHVTASAPSWAPPPAGGAFAEDTAYTLTMTLTPDDGYAFDSGLTATLGGVQAAVSIDPVTGVATLTFHFQTAKGGGGGLGGGAATPVPTLNEWALALLALLLAGGAALRMRRYK